MGIFRHIVAKWEGQENGQGKGRVRAYIADVDVLITTQRHKEAQRFAEENDKKLFGFDPFVIPLEDGTSLTYNSKERRFDIPASSKSLTEEKPNKVNPRYLNMVKMRDPNEQPQIIEEDKYYTNEEWPAMGGKFQHD